jgi:hypothetical protein
VQTSQKNYSFLDFVKDKSFKKSLPGIRNWILLLIAPIETFLFGGGGEYIDPITHYLPKHPQIIIERAQLSFIWLIVSICFMFFVYILVKKGVLKE